MTSHEAKAQALAEKIAKKAEDALAGLDREMTIMKWPAEFRAIMWETVANVAARNAIDMRMLQAERPVGQCARTTKEE